MRLLFFSICIGFVALPSVGHAEIIETFDFEDLLPPQTSNNLELYSDPLTVNQGGISMTIRHENEVPFALSQNIDTTFENLFGTRALTMFNGQNGVFDPGAIILDFDIELTSITVEMGDFGQDTDELLIQTFSQPLAGGTIVSEATGTLQGGGNSFSIESVTAAGAGIRSVRMIGGSPQFANSVFYDNITVTAIPEPSVLASLPILTVCLIFRSRRRSRPDRHRRKLLHQRLA